MKNEIITISSGVFAGAVARGGLGAANITSPTVKGLLAALMTAGGGYLAITTKGATTQAAVIRGMGIGFAFQGGNELLKTIGESNMIAAKLDGTGKIAKFAKDALGLGYYEGLGNYAESPALNGFNDAEGNYHEEGASHYLTPNGELMAYNEPEMLGSYIDENGQYVEDGLNGIVGEDGKGNYVYN